MKVSMKVVLEGPDGSERSETLTADARDIRAYEAEFDQSFLTSDNSLTQLTQVSFVTLRRQGKFVGPWEAFDAQCVEVEGVDEGEAESARPTQQGPGEGSSQP